ncbi:hypothetical protein [Lysinibacillus xylanilyticus]|nr:hypothetical protein [Lysinibacillus xylanilyticus]
MKKIFYIGVLSTLILTACNEHGAHQKKLQLVSKRKLKKNCKGLY